MTLTAIYSFVSKNAIPKKKVGIMEYHNIPRIKVGKYTKILRAELDKFFEPPKIE